MHEQVIKTRTPAVAN